MTSAHTQAILNDEPIYLTGTVTKIPVIGKRSYSHRIKVHKRRSIKPQLVKDELKFQKLRAAKAQARLNKLIIPKPLFFKRMLQPRQGVVERLLNKLKRKRG